MKRINWFLLAALLVTTFVFILQSCLKDKITETYSYTYYTPVYKARPEVYANIKSNAPKEVSSPGKIFLYGNYIFLNEVNKGVHIIDNSDPSLPVRKAFIDIPGNLDIAVKGNTLYADLYTDLITIDISDPLQTRLVKNIPSVFPERYYGNGYNPDSNHVLVDWIRRDTTITVRIEKSGWRGRYYFASQLADVNSGGGNNGGSASTPPGISGSMARFVIVNNYLYAVNSHELGVFNISNTNNPQKVAASDVGWNIETIYPFQNKLFIGSMSGMFIYDISNPASPVQQGQFSHASACDPVISDGSYAYITLRDGTRCTGFNNELDVVNISNLMSPSLIKTYPMTHPFGLSKDNNILFVCDGTDGIKIYNASDPSNINLLKHVTGIETYDAIAWNKNLLVVAKDGLYQYDYTDIINLRLLSKIGIVK